MVRFGVAAAIPVATALNRSRSITWDNPVVTVGLRSSVGPIPNHRSPVAAGEALPEEATSLGGSSVQPARLFTWWKRPGSSLTRPALLGPLQPRTFRPIGSPENRPSCLGNSVFRSLTGFAVFSKEIRPRRGIGPAALLCRRCGAYMLKRTSKFGPFWGCSQFPRCGGRRKKPQRAEIGQPPWMPFRINFL